MSAPLLALGSLRKRTVLAACLLPLLLGFGFWCGCQAVDANPVLEERKHAEELERDLAAVRGELAVVEAERTRLANKTQHLAARHDEASRENKALKARRAELEERRHAAQQALGTSGARRVVAEIDAACEDLRQKLDAVKKELAWRDKSNELDAFLQNRVLYEENLSYMRSAIDAEQKRLDDVTMPGDTWRPPLHAWSVARDNPNLQGAEAIVRVSLRRFVPGESPQPLREESLPKVEVRQGAGWEVARISPELGRVSPGLARISPKGSAPRDGCQYEFVVSFGPEGLYRDVDFGKFFEARFFTEMKGTIYPERMAVGRLPFLMRRGKSLETEMTVYCPPHDWPF